MMSTFYDKNIEYRKKEFKKGIDTDDSRRKRDNMANQIRKQKRLDNLTKKRCPLLHPILNDKDAETKEIINYEHIDKIFDDKPDVVLEGLIFIRRYLSKKELPEIDIDTNYRFLYKVIEYITYTNYPKHQMEATWIMTNAIAGNSKSARKILDNTPLIQYALESTKSPNRDIRDQAIWCAGNIAGEQDKYLQYLIDNGIVNIILNSIYSLVNDTQKNDKTLSMLRNQSWALSNVFRAGHIPLQSCPLIQIIGPILSTYTDNELLSHLSWIVAYITKKLNNQDMDIFMNLNILTSDNIKLLRAKQEISVPMLRAYGNLLVGPENICAKLINIGFLSYIPYLLSSYPDHRKETCWILSNISANGKHYNKLLVDSNIIELVFNAYPTGSFLLQKECIYLFSNIISTKTSIDYMVEQGVIDIFSNFLKPTTSKDLLLVILESIYTILKYSDNGITNKYISLVEDSDCLDKIEKLQYHDSIEIYNAAVNIMDEFFNNEPNEQDITFDFNNQTNFKF